MTRTSLPLPTVHLERVNAVMDNLIAAGVVDGDREILDKASAVRDSTRTQAPLVEPGRTYPVELTAEQWEFTVDAVEADADTDDYLAGIPGFENDAAMWAAAAADMRATASALRQLL